MNDWEGRPATDEETATQLGFANVTALNQWSRLKEKDAASQLQFVLAECCNLIERVKEQRKEIDRLRSIIDVPDYRRSYVARDEVFQSE